MSRLVPLLREGADDVERALLAAARHDGPPDGVARRRTLAALRAASGTATVAGAGAGWRWLHLLKPATLSWLAAGGLGAAVTFGAGAWLVRDRTPPPEVSSPRAAASAVVAPSLPVPASLPLVPSVRAPAPPAVAPAGTRPLASAPPASPPLRPGRAAARALSGRPVPEPPPTGATPPLSPLALPPAATREGGVTGSPSPASLEAVAAPPAIGAGSVAPPAPPSSSLRDEAALLESVRESLAASRAEDALGSLDAYDARFASGALEEEAAVLRVQALLARGRRDEARRISADFGRRHPASSYVRRMRSLVEAK